MPFRAGAFTLLEILVVLALLGLMSGVLIGGTARWLDARDSDVEGATLRAIAQARERAIQSGQPVALAAASVWHSKAKATTQRREVQFLPPEMGATTLVGGRLREEALPAVNFYPDGTCDPFRVQLGDAEPRRLLVIDPWTCVVVGAGQASR